MSIVFVEVLNFEKIYAIDGVEFARLKYPRGYITTADLILVSLF